MANTNKGTRELRESTAPGALRESPVSQEPTDSDETVVPDESPDSEENN